MLPAHLRLAELYHAQSAGPLTIEHAVELQQCLQANVRYCWDTIKLRQLSMLAVSTQDVTWLNDLCLREEALRLTRRAPTL